MSLIKDLTKIAVRHAAQLDQCQTPNGSINVEELLKAIQFFEKELNKAWALSEEEPQEVKEIVQTSILRFKRDTQIHISVLKNWLNKPEQ